jgi:hypothetical protein
MAKSKSKSPPKRASSKSATPKTSAGPTLEQRVKRLETHVKELSLTASAGPGAGALPAMTAAAPAGALVFSLGPNPPTIVKLTLDGSEVLILGTAPVQSKPKPKGVVVSLLIDLHGSAGQTASITVSNAIPAAITATIPPGRSDWSESRALLPQ